ncbi:hypothetical protein RND81_08G085700 [Saponaria officinalis]|uniref:Uncharacterized protein n=1 Tax=Saponaria officinalis TaxID=3572 RepID=A0AAW1J7N0_SAPOF
MTRRRITIPFYPLLTQITEFLHFPEPVYQLLDESTNNALAYVYVGGEAETIGESCEKASQKAVRDLIKKNSVHVEDITSTRILALKKCADLYRLKRDELENLEKGKAKKQGGNGILDRNSVPCVCVDYLSIVRTIFRNIETQSTPIETVECAPGQFVSLLTITPFNRVNLEECMFSDPFPGLVAAKQNLAKKIIAYLVPLYNIEVIDANYGAQNSTYSSVVCALERESYLTARERILGIKELMEPSVLLVEQDCVTPRPASYQIPTINSPPLPPKKRKYNIASDVHSAVGASGTKAPNYFSVPEELEMVFKRTKK